MVEKPLPSTQLNRLRPDACLAAMMQAVPLPIFAVDHAGLVLAWNSGAERVFGWPAEEAIGCFLPSVPEDRRDAFAALRGRVMYEGEVASPVVRWHRRDSTPIELSLSTSLIRDDGGATMALLIVATERTTHHVVQDATAQATLDRYRLILAQSRDSVFFVRADTGYILEANSAAVVAYGYSLATFLTLNIGDLGLSLQEAQLATGEAPTMYEAEQIRANGSTFPAVVRTSVAPINGEATLLLIVHDISARRQADAERGLLRTALAAAANAVVITNTHAQVEWANPAFTELTGYTVAEVFGRKTSLLRSGLHENAFYTQMWDTILTGTVWRGEMTNKRKDGSFYVEEMTITPVFTDGQVTHFVAIKQEVTARVERDREREALLSLAEALRQARTRAELLPTLLEQTRILLKAHSAALAVRDPITGETVFEVGLGAWVELSMARMPPGVSVTGRVIATGALYQSDDMQSDPAFADLRLPSGVRAAICAPLRVDDTVIGALWVGRQNPMSKVDARLITAIADLAANAIHRATLSEQTERRLRHLVGLRTIDQAITGSFDIRLSLNVLLDQTVQQLGVDAAAVLLLNPHSLSLEHAAGRGFRTGAILSAPVRLGEGLSGRAALERKTLIERRVSLSDGGVMRQNFIAAEGFESYIAVPLVAKGHVRGVLEVFHRSPLAPDAEWLDFLETLASQAAVAVDNAELFQHMQRANIDLALAYDTTLEGWSRALELRDKETEGHSQRVTALTVRLARAMGLSEEEIVHIRRGALLHDIGKMGIPDAILLKPGPLTPEEREVIKQHPGYAYVLLKPIPFLRPALDIPYYHHERWDGTGYPRGLAGDEIPLAARMFAVVDVYDAVTSNRPYQTAWPLEKACALLAEEAGRHFDPEVVAAFLRILDKGDGAI